MIVLKSIVAICGVIATLATIGKMLKEAPKTFEEWICILICLTVSCFMIVAWVV